MAGKATAVCGLAGTAWIITDVDRRDGAVGVVNGGGRFCRAVFHSTAVVADYKLGLVKLEKGSPEYEMKRKAIHQRAADRLLHVCRKHGGVYTKFGQHLASLNHVLPKVCKMKLISLRNYTPPAIQRERESCFLMFLMTYYYQSFGLSMNGLIGFATAVAVIFACPSI